MTMMLSTSRSTVILLLVTLLVALASGSTFGSRRSVTSRVQSTQERTPSAFSTIIQSPTTTSMSAILVRGGSDSEDEDEEEEDGSSSVGSTAMDTALEIGVKVMEILGKATIEASKVVSRSISAAFNVPEEEIQEEATMFSKVLSTLQRMFRAAVTPEDDSNGVDADDTSASTVTKKTRKSKKRSAVAEEEDELVLVEDPESMADFGQFLARQYGVLDGRNPDEYALPILGGSVGEALQVARSKARLLVAYIPAARPSKKSTGTKTPDQLAIRSLLSSDVSKMTEKKARKSAETPGSFLLWGAKAGSPEAVAAMKRLKAKQPKGSTRPTLIVVYPAQVFSSSTGTVKIVPRLLAQHHCSPPPTPETMAAWLNALRKRHAKQFAAMHHQQKEEQLFRERHEGYKSSIVSDVERRQQDKLEVAAKLAEQEAEKERIAALEERRETLKESLPEEPSKDDKDAMTIALRFTDGRAGQRRFDSTTPIMTVFNWVDAHYEMEREQITLTTMNGQKTFSWEDMDESQTLAEAGLGRMTGLRVIEKAVAIEEDVADGKEGDDDEV